MEQRISTKKVQEIYDVSEKTLCMWKKNLGMPHRKIGRDCYYLLSELLEWDSAHKLPRKSKLQVRSA